MPILNATKEDNGPDSTIYQADSSGMPKEIGSLKRIMQMKKLKACLLGCTKDKNSGKTVFKLTVGTHELESKRVNAICSEILQDLIPEVLRKLRISQMEFEHIPVMTMLFQIQPTDVRANEIAIPVEHHYDEPRPTDDPTNVTCVFAFEGLSVITYSHVCEDIACLEQKALFLSDSEEEESDKEDYIKWKHSHRD